MTKKKSAGKLGKSHELDLLEHLEKILELSEGSKLEASFFEKAKVHLAHVTQKLEINSIQAVIFAHILNNSAGCNVSLDEIASSIKCSKIKFIRYTNECEELEQKKFICCRRRHDNVSYRVPVEVRDALRKGEAFKPEIRTNLNLDEFFLAIETLFEQRSNNELPYDMLLLELDSLVDNNMQLEFSRKMKNYNLRSSDKVLLFCFFHQFVNEDDDSVGFHDFDELYDSKSTFKDAVQGLKNGDNGLLEKKFIENTNDNGFGDRENFKLTDATKHDFLSEMDVLLKKGKNKKDLRASCSLPEKKMFYNEADSQKIDSLTSLLQNENFSAVQKRLSDSGMRTGFACLFSGAPGTGKTETVYQIARKTGRDIMQVDISDTKSMWFGESEKKIKELFDRYKGYVKSSDIVPILLFNEADAVIGKRKEVTADSRAIDQTENTIQNIILQEIENLTGILIATTNLTQNLDKAFERRFLYKIEFEKPNHEARKSIWQTMIPSLSGTDATELASRYDFSGGQIENISRKRAVENVLSGTEPSLPALCAFCDDELLVKESAEKIGFMVR